MQIHFEFRQCAGLRGDNQTTLSFVIANHASSSLTSDRLPFDVPHMCWNEFMTADLALRWPRCYGQSDTDLQIFPQATSTLLGIN